MTIIIATLSLFWLVSGIVGIVRANQAAVTLEMVGWSHQLAVAGVLLWVIVDIAP